VNPFRIASGNYANSLIGNVTRPISVLELIADATLLPGMTGCYIENPVGGRGYGIRFEHISQLSIIHRGLEFMLTRETLFTPNGQILSGRYRIYSGMPDRITPPIFLRTRFNGDVVVERIIGHTHPHPVPFQPGWNQPSGEDIQYLLQIRVEWQRVYGANSEPFGLIFGDPGDRAVIYGPRSTPGNAVPP
jgi:hypothetical protein